MSNPIDLQFQRSLRHYTDTVVLVSLRQINGEKRVFYKYLSMFIHNCVMAFFTNGGHTLVRI